jgi:ATP-dependent helicase HepA
MPVRWLLADEVGLGKTIEAALIMNRLLHTQDIERCLVVAPEALTVQWLGELWRKYHQVFTLLDPPRLADVVRDFGAGFNPFDVYRRAVIALKRLVERPELTGQADGRDRSARSGRGAAACAAAPASGRAGVSRGRADRRSDGTCCCSAQRRSKRCAWVLPAAAAAAAGGVSRGHECRGAARSGVPLPACTSSTRRVDIGGLPPSRARGGRSSAGDVHAGRFRGRGR